MHPPCDCIIAKLWNQNEKEKSLSTISPSIPSLVLTHNWSSPFLVPSKWVLLEQEHKNNYSSEVSNDVKDKGIDSNFHLSDKGNGWVITLLLIKG